MDAIMAKSAESGETLSADQEEAYVPQHMTRLSLPSTHKLHGMP